MFLAALGAVIDGLTGATRLELAQSKQPSRAVPLSEFQG